MRSPARRREDIALVAGLAVLALALSPWLDGRADRLFSWHMAQHVLIMMVAAPLLLLGAPLRRIVAALPVNAARRVSALLHHRWVAVVGSPLVGWLALPLSLYFAHFSPLYEAALEHEPIHAFEHGLFLVAALLYWNPVLAVAPSPNALRYHVRIFYVFVSMPIQAFLALVLYTANHPLYPYYERQAGTAAALRDQASGAELMWFAGGFTLFIAVMTLAVAWIRDEERRAVVMDRRLFG